MGNSAVNRPRSGQALIGARRPGARPWLIALLVFALLAGGCSPPPPLRVGSNQWVGYEALYLARSLGHYDPTLIKLVELPSSTEVQQALRERQFVGRSRHEVEPAGAQARDSLETVTPRRDARGEHRGHRGERRCRQAVAGGGESLVNSFSLLFIIGFRDLITGLAHEYTRP